MQKSGGSPFVLLCRNFDISISDETERWIKFTSLQHQFDFATSFARRHPTAEVELGSYDPPNEIRQGTLFDYSDSTVPARVDRDALPPFNIEASCRIVGRRSSSHAAYDCPRTRLPIPLQIWVKVNDIVELEDLDLGTDFPNGPYSFGGKNIVFRRCRFSGAENGSRVAHGARPGRTNGALKVTYERCVFENCPKNGLLVGTGGNVLLLDCVFRTCSTALSVQSGGVVVAKHCSFLSCKIGINAVNPDTSVELHYCTFEKLSSDVVAASHGCSVFMKGCRVNKCPSASVVFEGPHGTKGTMEDSGIYECKNGLIVRRNRCEVTVSNSQCVKNKFGLFIMWDAIGSVSLNNCTFAQNIDDNVEIWSSTKCIVTVDGTVLPPKPVEVIKREIFRHYRGSENLQEQRRFKVAGVGDIKCFKCGAVEGENSFKKCSRCKMACYCSRICQTTHWAAHERDCEARDEVEEV